MNKQRYKEEPTIGSFKIGDNAIKDFKFEKALLHPLVH